MTPDEVKITPEMARDFAIWAQQDSCHCPAQYGEDCQLTADECNARKSTVRA